MGADYAEYFEWNDGNVNSEDRRGYFVGLYEDKIILATNSSQVIGIVSSAPGVIGDSAELSWSGTNEKDDFGNVKTKDSYYNPMTKLLSNTSKLNTELKSILNLNDTVTIKDDVKTYFDTKLLLLESVLDNSIININVELTELDENDTSMNTRNSIIKNNLEKDLYTIISLSPSETDNMIGNGLEPINLETIKDQVISYIIESINNLTNAIDMITPIQITYHSENFNPDEVYIPRSQRTEWCPVGLMGKIYVNDNGNCVVGSKCSCENGIAIPGTDWWILERKTSNIIRILYK